MFFKGINHIVGAAVFGAALIAATAGNATPIQITGTSDGSFTDVQHCHTGDCAITNGGTVLKWGSTDSRHDLRNPSTLTANEVHINETTDANNVVIGMLTWYNSATLDSQTPDYFNVNYTLTLSFTQPGSLDVSKTFDLTIINTTNPTGDMTKYFTLVDLSSLVINLPGVTISDLHYATDPHSKLINGVWYNKEGKTAKLYILADFTADPTPPAPAPEPATLALMGAGLAGVATRMRRKSKR